MTDMAQEFLDEIQREIHDFLAKYVDTLVADTSEFIYVDGEEGDHGKITYTDPYDKKLICTRIIEGGDVESFEFTQWGRGMFLSLLVGVRNNFR